MTPIPREPVGDSALVQTIKQLIRCVRERQILPDPSITLERTSEGTRIIAKGGKGGTGGPSTDLPVWL